ncbi:MAG: beta-galactosidase, partial [Candidatus Omnitrophica bacterium]|nr:beta-galactosidase [Candidatus Omnitrophota bacterium]
MRRALIVGLILSAIFVFYGYVVQADSVLKLGLSFPPIKTEKHREFTLKHLRKLGIEHIRSAVAWENIEPVKGKFKWGGLDKRLQFM